MDAVEALRRIRRLRHTMLYAMDDPMSQYAPMGDFYEDWDRRLRSLWATVYRLALNASTRELALRALEQWMP